MRLDSELQRLLVGRCSDPMIPFGTSGVRLHREVIPPLEALVAAAAGEGIGLEVASGFREFDRQAKIWNEKARGERPLLDAAESPVDASQLSPEQRVFALLRWTALPGASRHHWGTDLDVFDRSALSPGAEPLLERREAEHGGTFARLHAWLDENLDRFGFFRPYDRDRGGVRPEPWHLSYAPVSRHLQEAFSLELLQGVLGGTELELKEVVLRHIETIYARYVDNVATSSRA
ncbi:M15 family metallopeptidase [Anaeromyxobacter sp. Fw109-5]|uniref:M15 family metallopeptidase n=1 Tax=Anaeromyxobacter sp. (strain Fw109-5) TaxID=404589 RepID=UPI0000ED7D6E|nr:M15 family metallopeptidase [Anaeromyxobacter sp. Fw109-5]ABS25636.1 peptidase M15B and M15C DD-carboxypeptidase VanY/endolysin [Anaeromyxobacter sp. Fw109-5]